MLLKIYVQLVVARRGDLLVQRPQDRIFYFLEGLTKQSLLNNQGRGNPNQRVGVEGPSQYQSLPEAIRHGLLCQRGAFKLQTQHGTSATEFPDTRAFQNFSCNLFNFEGFGGKIVRKKDL